MRNLNSLKVFQVVYSQKSMTEAAKILHLTQSGVSQHIKNFEDELGFTLFERVKQRLLPTTKADEMFRKTNPLLSGIDDTIHHLQATDETPGGVVRLGLPIQYGHNVVIPELAQIGRENESIAFEITLGFATTLSQKVLNGELDFALIDRYRVDKKLRTETVAREAFLLCAHKEYVQRQGPIQNTIAYFSRLDYVDYQENEPFVRSWFKHHLGRSNLSIRVRAHLFDVLGVAKFISHRLGAGVLPDHLAERLIADGEQLHIYYGKKLPLENEMQMIYLPTKDRPRVQTMVMNRIRAIGNVK
jgi:LysR family transcriptional regulator, transcriptional activator of the cysJI operon